ncbi:MAG: hypothetical protein ACXVBV_16725 [Isosphaeraceae bacterium]
MIVLFIVLLPIVNCTKEAGSAKITKVLGHCWYNLPETVDRILTEK